jgi:hypothetical protein
MRRGSFLALCSDNGPLRSPVRLLLLGLLPLAIVACGGGGTSSGTTAAATTTTTATHQVKSVTIKVTSVVKSTRSHDTPPKGTSQGDKVDFHDVLLNATPQFGKNTNERVGTDTGTMTFTSKSTARLDGIANLPDGTISFSGLVTVLADSSITVPVIGGTGKYKNASGTLLVGAGNKRSPNTYKLVIEGVPGPVA